jgi:hypothetical protein
MQHISTALISANYQRTPLDSLLITILSFIGQNDIAKIEIHHKAEQVAKNERNLNFMDTHHKVTKSTIKGLGMITGI